MIKTKNLAICLLVLIVMILLGALLEARQIIPWQWTAKLIYLKDERTKACFALKPKDELYSGPYFTYVPCELVERADWFAYEKRLK